MLMLGQLRLRLNLKQQLKLKLVQLKR